ncbi:AI-2E family transporter [Arsenicicoccus sp. oral taxon 190]|uniref:AI-2E family transporter n=1 Tax=Arsenicicoccus sp. oral taxon 190 TaxID=1658671 RepID=UPI00067B694E|nr:AI-2E family transporter [Arsenicicoccus sp. oral taxon 190]
MDQDDATPPGGRGDAAADPGDPGRLRGALGSVTRTVRARLDAPPPSQWGTQAVAPTVHVTVPERSDDDANPIPTAVRVAAAWSWRLILIVAAVYLVARGLAAAPIVTIPFVVALLLTAVLSPVQRRLHHGARVPHSLAAFLALLLGIVVIGAIVTFVVMQITANWPRMAQQFSQFIDQTAQWLRAGPLHMSDKQVEKYLQEASDTVSKNQGTLLSGAITTVSTLSEVVAGGLLLLLSTFFLLRDGEVIWRWVIGLLPSGSRRRVDQVGRVGWHTLGGYMRGVTIIATLHATTIYVVLHVLDVPMAVALSVLIFVGSFIPLIGMTVTGCFCIAVSLIEHGPGAALVVAITIVVLVQLEAHLLQPLIMSRNVEVHPLGVALSVLAGTSIAGVAGALFAVPIVAFANATLRAVNLPLPPTEEARETQARGAAGELSAEGAPD